MVKAKNMAFLSAVVILFASVCFADGTTVDFDVNKYSRDELAQIYGIISNKLNDCVIIPQGYYVVGEDLPAGKYTILDNDDTPGNTYSDYGWVAVFANMEDYKNETSHYSWNKDDSKNLIWENTLWGGFTFELTDGMVLVVGFGKAGIKKVDAGVLKTFWD